MRPALSGTSSGYLVGGDFPRCLDSWCSDLFAEFGLFMGWADPLVDWRIHSFMFECVRGVMFAFFVCFMTFGSFPAAAFV